MNAQLTTFDTKFLSDCGVAVEEPVRDQEAARVKAHRVDQQDRDAAAIYYRRIVEELG